MKNYIYITLALLFVIFALTACNSNEETNITSGEQISGSNVAERQSNFDKSTFIDIVRKSINNDVWYYGTDSSYYDFISKSSMAVIYNNPSQYELLNYSGYTYAVLFETKFLSPYSNAKVYFVVEFWTDNNGNFGDTPQGCFVEENYSKIISRLDEHGYKPLYSTDISFDENIQAPVFDEMTKEKEERIAAIESLFIDWLRDNGRTGTYKVTMKNFDINDSNTYLIVENSDVNWAVDVIMESVILIHKAVNIGDDISQYTANRFKKDALYSKDITVN